MSAETQKPPKRPPGAPTAVSADLLRPVPRYLNALMLVMIMCVAAFVAWSMFADLDETTKGQGRVIPARKLQVVQNLEGGIVREIHVREGMTVARGEVLLRIDPTQARSRVNEAGERIVGLRALVQRLQAEMSGKELTFSPELVESNPTLIAHQRALFEARQREYRAAISSLKSQQRQRAQEIVELRAKIGTLKRGLSLAEQQLAIIRPLARDRAASKAELLNAETKVNETRGALEAAELAVPRVESQLAEARDREAEKAANFRADALRKLAEARVELAALEQANTGSTDKLVRTVVRAPTSGIVKTLAVTTVGQVVQPGKNLVEIVPLDDTLLVEARISPQDIAFLRPGQPAVVKLTAYDFSLYGGLNGQVETIGADSITTEKGETFYVIKVRTESSQLKRGADVFRIIPGMVAEVDILTGKKSVFAYLTKPLTRMRHVALTER
ncbi:MAG: HlyD family type I secretion periplasmic adaptor subunit [Pseudomonadota bacterium]